MRFQQSYLGKCRLAIIELAKQRLFYLVDVQNALFFALSFHLQLFSQSRHWDQLSVLLEIDTYHFFIVLDPVDFSGFEHLRHCFVRRKLNFDRLPFENLREVNEHSEAESVSIVNFHVSST